MFPAYYLSIDLGATSGRTIIAKYDGERVEMSELTRFETKQIHRDGHVFWNLPQLRDEILFALQKIEEQGITLTSIGIDTWGCDVAFFDKNGELIGLPYCYRDPHTDGAMERYFAECMPQQELYERTGIQFMPFNTLFQLDTIRRENKDASTSQMLNPHTGDLDTKILASIGMKRERFGRLVKPGERVGVLSRKVQEMTGLGPVPVVAVGSHDTASAVASIPAEDGNYAYLSCGTWSLLGIESPTPIINEASFRHNFTNEGGLDGTIRFLKNITGLWLLEGCRKEWTEGQVPTDVNALNALCLSSSLDSLINPDDPRFAHPDSMTTAIRDYLAETGQELPQKPADYVRVIFRSLANRYVEVINILRDISPVDIQRLHVIGGGSKNEYLMQFAADALQIPVIAGPKEGTALGNALVQIRAAGLVGSLQEMRAIVRKSIEIKEYK